MELYELVKMRGLDSKAVKLIRHQELTYDINMLYKTGFINDYQSVQSKDIFKGCQYILSFLGVEATKAIYIGAYKKISMTQTEVNSLPIDYPYKEHGIGNYYRYKFEKIDLLEDMVDRLVIEWGKSTRMWHQWLKADNPKEVIEILPKGYVNEFSGFDEIVLSFDELEAIVKNYNANKIWHTMLSSVAGVYLIVDRISGNQYVGSAYGEKGILGRWADYVKTHHGGNVELMTLLEKEPSRYKNFTYSVLRTLPKTLTQTEVISVEQRFKEKLGTRAFGLNAN